jgi:hypothetical protein
LKEAFSYKRIARGGEENANCRKSVSDLRLQKDGEITHAGYKTRQRGTAMFAGFVKKCILNLEFLNLQWTKMKGTMENGGHVFVAFINFIPCQDQKSKLQTQSRDILLESSLEAFCNYAIHLMI